MYNNNEAEISSLKYTIKRKINSAGLRFIHRLESVFKKWPRQFCLITGAPRSGTTAMERWLHSQTRVAAFHETRILIAIHRFLEETQRHKSLGNQKKFAKMGRNVAFDFYRKQCNMIEHDLLIEKEPLELIAFPDKNYALFLQNYRLLFPNGKLLFMIRDPLAAIWSMKERKWGHSLYNYTPQSFSLDSHIQNWCDCAEIILDYADDKNSFVCSFENLVAKPEEESNRIFEFLQISGGKEFQPRPVKTVQFEEEEKLYIDGKTRSYQEELAAAGVLSK